MGCRKVKPVSTVFVDGAMDATDRHYDDVDTSIVDDDEKPPKEDWERAHEETKYMAIQAGNQQNVRSLAQQRNASQVGKDPSKEPGLFPLPPTRIASRGI